MLKTTNKILIGIFLLFALLGLKSKLSAQIEGNGIDPFAPNFSNPVITTDCCPIPKQIIDDIMKNSPFVFEGRMIRGRVSGGWDTDIPFNGYLFEIGKVYRGAEKLRAGTIELIMKFTGGPNIPFIHSWYVIFAKEINSSGVFDANNPIKLELYYIHRDDFSGFEEIRNTQFSKGEVISQTFSHYRGLFLDFRTQDEVRNFLSSYDLYPVNFSNPDTLKTMTRKEVEEEKQKIIRMAEWEKQNRENRKQHYRILLEQQFILDSASGKNADRRELEESMQEYENAADTARRRMLRNQEDELKRKIDENIERRNGELRANPCDAYLNFYIENVEITQSAENRFLEYDLMLRAEESNTYLYNIIADVEYESDSLGIPFQSNIVSDTNAFQATPGELFSGITTGLNSSWPKFRVESHSNPKIISLWYKSGRDWLTSYEVPVQGTKYAHIKMKLNSNQAETFFIPNVPLAIFNRTDTTDIANTERYCLRQDTIFIPLIPTPPPVITDYYINTPGNTTGCAGCGDILVIRGRNFGNKDITNDLDMGSTLAFKLGDFKTTQYDTIPYYRLQENHDYISWSNTEIKVKLPSLAIEKDTSHRNYLYQYPCTGLFKVITSGGEAESPGQINIKYVVDNYQYWYAGGQRRIKTPYLIPKIDCVNGCHFQVCPQLAQDSAALVCIKKAMRDWSDALHIDLQLKVYDDGNPIINHNPAWRKDSIHTIAYTETFAGGDPLNAMAVSDQNVVSCSYNAGIQYKDEFDIGINNSAQINWHKDPHTPPSNSQFCFYTAFLHELGHVLGLQHVANASDLMKTVLRYEERLDLTQPVIQDNALAGAQHIVRLSEDVRLWRDELCLDKNLEALNSTDGPCSREPSPPENFQVEPRRSLSMALRWDPVFNANQYVLQYATSSNFSEILSTDTLLQRVTEFIYSGVTPGRQYHFRIKSKNENGESEFVNVSNVVELPSAPDIQCNSISSTELQVTWSEVEDAMEYILQYSTSSTFSSVISTITLSCEITTKNYSALMPGTKYYFRIKSKNSTGESAYAITSNNVMMPTVPQNPECLASSNQIDVSWNTVSDANSYILQYSTTSSFSSILDSYTLSYGTTNKTISGLTPGINYYFRVKSKNTTGESEYAETNCVTDCFTAGNGTLRNPYQITMSSQLDCFHNYVGSANNEAYFVIAAGVTIVRTSGNLTIPSNTTLTVKGNLTMPNYSQILIRNTGKFTIDGGNVKNANIKVNSQGYLTLSNNGILEKGMNNELLTIDLGAVFNLVYGEIRE